MGDRNNRENVTIRVARYEAAHIEYALIVAADGHKSALVAAELRELARVVAQQSGNDVEIAKPQDKV